MYLHRNISPYCYAQSLTSLMFVPWDGNLLSGNLRALWGFPRALQSSWRIPEIQSTPLPESLHTSLSEFSGRAPYCSTKSLRSLMFVPWDGNLLSGNLRALWGFPRALQSSWRIPEIQSTPLPESLHTSLSEFSGRIPTPL